VPINLSEIRDFVSVLAQTDITELTLKSDDFELTVRKDVNSKTLTVTAPAAPPAEESVPVVQSSEIPSVAQETPLSPLERNYVPVTCPMVGTFYVASAPEESPFVAVNDRIRPGQVLCIIEAMKLMNDIESEISGQIMEIVVTNGEPVEYGQTLMWVKPE